MKNFKSKISIVSILLLCIFAVSCKKDKDTGPHYIITQIGEIELEKPYQINILFQITDNEKIGIADKISTDFIIKEKSG